MEYEFVLIFALANDEDPIQQLSALKKSVTANASIGIGKSGFIAFEFNQIATSAEDAILSAIVDVQKAIPDAELVKVMPEDIYPAD